MTAKRRSDKSALFEVVLRNCVRLPTIIVRVMALLLGYERGGRSAALKYSGIFRQQKSRPRLHGRLLLVPSLIARDYSPRVKRKTVGFKREGKRPHTSARPGAALPLWSDCSEEVLAR